MKTTIVIASLPVLLSLNGLLFASETSSYFPFEKLPFEIIQNIGYRLSEEDLISFTRVDERAYKILTKEQKVSRELKAQATDIHDLASLKKKLDDIDREIGCQSLRFEPLKAFADRFWKIGMPAYDQVEGFRRLFNAFNAVPEGGKLQLTMIEEIGALHEDARDAVYDFVFEAIDPQRGKRRIKQVTKFKPIPETGAMFRAVEFQSVRDSMPDDVTTSYLREWQPLGEWQFNRLVTLVSQIGYLPAGLQYHKVLHLFGMLDEIPHSQCKTVLKKIDEACESFTERAQYASRLRAHLARGNCHQYVQNDPWSVQWN